MPVFALREKAALQGAYVDLQQLLALRFLPAPAQLKTATARIVGNRAGSKLSKLKGRGVDLAEVRAYQPGDDIRSIDWRVTARTNKPHTKIFREERERPTLIVVDQTQNMFFGSRLRLKSVAAADVAARVAWQTLQANDRVGGLVVGNDQSRLHKPFRTTKAVARLLNDISEINQALRRNVEVTGTLTEAMLRVRRLARSNYRIFIISDFAGDLTDWANHLQQLARHNQVTAVHIHDPIERELPPSDHYLVTDGAERLQFYTGDRGLRDRYLAQFEGRCADLEHICLHDSMRYIPIATDKTDLASVQWL